jgi:hypothetical protein
MRDIGARRRHFFRRGHHEPQHSRRGFLDHKAVVLGVTDAQQAVSLTVVAIPFRLEPEADVAVGLLQEWILDRHRPVEQHTLAGAVGRRRECVSRLRQTLSVLDLGGCKPGKCRDRIVAGGDRR